MRVILACVAAATATVVPAVALRADCPSPKELATREYEERIEEESIERNARIAELKLGNSPAKAAKEQMEFDHWLASKKLAHEIRLEKIDLEAAVSETAGRCLSMDELLRRCDVHARWKRETEDLRHEQALETMELDKKDLNASLAVATIDALQIPQKENPDLADKLAIIKQREKQAWADKVENRKQRENQIHADKLAMIELTCAQQKEIIGARHGQCPYSEMKLQYVHELRRMPQEHRNKMQLKRLEHESNLLELEEDRLELERRLLEEQQRRVRYENSFSSPENDLATRIANIDADIAAEKLRYPHTVALETLRYEHDLKRSDPDLRWKVSTGRLDAGTLWMLKQTDAQWRREEEMLRHRQVLEELVLPRGATVSELLAGIAETRADIWYKQAVQKENALHRRTLRDIEAICPPRDSSDCRCIH